MGLQIGGVEFSDIFEPKYDTNCPSYGAVVQENGVNIKDVYFARQTSSNIDKVNGISPYAVVTYTNFGYPLYFSGRDNVGLYYLQKYRVYYGNAVASGQFTGTPNVTITSTNASYNIGSHAYVGILVIAGGNNGAAGENISNSQNSGGGGKGGDSGQLSFTIIPIVPNSTMNITIGGAGQDSSVIYQHPVNGATTITAHYNISNKIGGAATLGGVANGTASTLTRAPVSGNAGGQRTSINTVGYTATVTVNTAGAPSAPVNVGTTNDQDPTGYYKLYAGGSGGSNGACGLTIGVGIGGAGGNGKSPSVEGTAGTVGGNASGYGCGGGGGGGAGGNATSKTGGGGGSGFQGVVYIFY